MESRIQYLFLACAIFASAIAQAKDDSPIRENDDQTILDVVVDPGIKRNKVDERKIDTENFEVGVYAGVMSIEDFGSNNVYGIRAAFHISEDWFIEGVLGETKASESSWETLSRIPRLSEEERKLTYYNASLGVNLFPGEVFLGKNRSFNTSYYLIAGIGGTEFAGDKFFTYNFGGGFRLAATDWIAFHVDFRNHLFSHNIFGEDKSIQNLETHMGMTVFF